MCIYLKASPLPPPLPVVENARFWKYPRLNFEKAGGAWMVGNENVPLPSDSESDEEAMEANTTPPISQYSGELEAQTRATMRHGKALYGSNKTYFDKMHVHELEDRAGNGCPAAIYLLSGIE